MRSNMILSICILIGLCALTQSAFADYRDNIDRTFKVHEGGTLVIESDLGSIAVTTSRNETVTLRIIREIDSNRKSTIENVLDNLDISIEQRGDDVMIRTEYDWDRWGFFSWMFNGGNRLKLTYEVEIPERYNIDLKTAGGKITVEDLDGRADCRTSGGSISLQSISGPVTAKTSGGSISVQDVGGDADLETSGGGIEVGDVAGDVQAHTSGGSILIERSNGTVSAKTSGGGITVNEVSGGIEAKTSGGGIKAYLSQQPTDDCQLTTSGGSITVYLNPECSFTVNARTSGGGVSTDLPVTITGELERNRLSADINGGGPELYLRTSGGGIHLREK